MKINPEDQNGRTLSALEAKDLVIAARDAEIADLRSKIEAVDAALDDLDRGRRAEDGQLVWYGLALAVSDIYIAVIRTAMGKPTPFDWDRLKDGVAPDKRTAQKRIGL